MELETKKGDDWIEVTIPIVTVSEANSKEHWTAKSKRHRRQKGAVGFALNPLRKCLKLPCHITMTRFAPRKLDKHDNLPISMKYILDMVCAILTGDYRPGRADDDTRISISYDQISSQEYGVKIHMKFT